jgi:hypothetical protein
MTGNGEKEQEYIETLEMAFAEIDAVIGANAGQDILHLLDKYLASRRLKVDRLVTQNMLSGKYIEKL